MNNSVHHQVVIVGGVTGGISVAARLLKGWFNHRDVAIIEPSDTHYYSRSGHLLAAVVFRKKPQVVR